MNPLSRAALAVATCFTLIGCGPREEATDSPVGAPVVSGPSVKLIPAPIFGGNLLLASGGRFAVATDSNAGKVIIADLQTEQVVRTITLASGSQPWRMVEDSRGRIRVTLRGTGQVATISISTGQLLSTESVCAEPRGLTWNAQTKELLVACASGELVTIPETGSMRSQFIKPDLRDVMLIEGKPWLSTFKSAELFSVEPSPAAPGVGLGRFTSVARAVGAPSTLLVPEVAWRTISTPTGFLTVHQLAVEGELVPPTATPAPANAPPVYYSGSASGCDISAVRSAITTWSPNGASNTLVIGGVLPVDVAVSKDGRRVAVALPGSLDVALGEPGQIGRSPFCSSPAQAPPLDPVTGTGDTFYGQPVGVAFTPDDRAVVLSINPLRLKIEPLRPAAGSTTPTQPWVTLDLSAETFETAGQGLFHTAPGAVACASCHPEGGDDGRVWVINGKQRRTMNLSGGILETAPFHWPGDLSNMNALMSDTFVSKMGGTLPPDFSTRPLELFLNKVKAPRVTIVNPDEVNRGQDLFTAAGCDGCHAGKAFTMPQNANVGTGESLQVPSLRGLGARAPYMHDGCAKTLEERFTNVACGGAQHGNMSALGKADLSSLVAYLNTL